MKDLITKIIWKLGISSPPVFIAGSPRSGTTWVLETLEKITEARIYWEPINWYLYNINHNRYSGDQTNLRPDSDKLQFNSNYKKEVFRILSAGAPIKSAMIRISRLSLIANLKRILVARNSIIKFVFAQRALSWIANNSDTKGCVIIRHPASVVASQISHPFKVDGNYQQHPEWTLEVIESTHPIYTDKDLLLFPGLKSVLQLELSPAGRLAVTACLDLLHSIGDAKVREKFAFVTYESLKDSPQNFVALAKYLDLPVKTQPDLNMLRARSRTTSEYSTNVPKGLERLSAQDIEQIQKIMDELNINLYNKDMTVNYDSILQLQFSNLIS